MVTYLLTIVAFVVYGICLSAIEIESLAVSACVVSFNLSSACFARVFAKFANINMHRQIDVQFISLFIQVTPLQKRAWISVHYKPTSKIMLINTLKTRSHIN